VPGGELLLMPAHGTAGLGVKLVTLNAGNPARGLPFIHGIYVLFDREGLVPEAILDGTALTAIRTAAVSALATEHLARPGAGRVVVFGAGAQARVHALAMCAVRPVEDVAIVGRDPARAEALVAELREQGVPARVGDAGSLAEADIVCACTTSATPLFDGTLLPDGVHVNAVGAYRADLRELDDAAMARGLVTVETRDGALAEAGDVVQAIAADAIAAEDLVELRDVVTGAAGRTSPDEVTIFKSVGLALEDLAVARAALSEDPQ
jgi:ornithine cyclodeaminase/alanine dehydrogenase-like protein (mu-crystallin family)